VTRHRDSQRTRFHITGFPLGSAVPVYESASRN
jgi:hypothetical protein